MSDDSLPPSGQRRTVTDAVASPHLADVSLPELRAYREKLRAEEERISYWRRLIHARVDLLRADALADSPVLDVDALGRVLGDTGRGQVRAALHRVRAADPLPDLPDLEAVWVMPTDAAGTEEAFERLGAAEKTLTSYRRGLHDRIDEATAELIVRYQQDPSRALELLTQ
ncbi:RsiG family protein [Nocardioides sp. GXZ039]|uniref:RsiG family protein n=1 Tax=Nocardioides sp. GXZ039 TaxID=3136018 RepID=UPI0030F3E788